jgi:hypothetical protein
MPPASSHVTLYCTFQNPGGVLEELNPFDELEGLNALREANLNAFQAHLKAYGRVDLNDFEGLDDMEEVVFEA